MVNAERSLVSWDYWLNSWPATPQIYTRGNGADGFPLSLTPLSQDLVQLFEEEGARVFFCETLAVMHRENLPEPIMPAFYGLIYSNVTQAAAMGDAMPGSSRQAMLEQIMGLQRDPSFVPSPKSAEQLAEEQRLGAAIYPRVQKLGRQLPMMIRRATARIRRARPALTDDLTESDLRKWLSRLDAIHTDAWCVTMAAGGLTSGSYETARRMLAEAAEDQNGDLLNRLHVGIGGNESAQAARAVRRLAGLARGEPSVLAALEEPDPLDAVRKASAAFAAEFDAVLDRFGYRAPAELELSRPSWRADPSQLLRVVRIEAARENEPQDEAVIRRGAERTVEKRLDAENYSRIWPVIKASRRFMALRENGKTPPVRIFDEVRILCEVAAPLLIRRGVLQAADDIFYLRHRELHEVLRGGDGPGTAELVKRRREHEHCLELDLTEMIEAGPDYLRPVDGSAFQALGMLPPEREAKDRSHLVGIPSAPGVATGTARVLLGPFDDLFEPGDILFARSVDPGWAPILGCAAAVVLDSGGPLSHGAMVARELGIPCVVNVKFGTELARSGSTVKVDGSTGEVLLSP